MPGLYAISYQQLHASLDKFPALSAATRELARQWALRRAVVRHAERVCKARGERFRGRTFPLYAKELLPKDDGEADKERISETFDNLAPGPAASCSRKGGVFVRKSIVDRLTGAPQVAPVSAASHTSGRISTLSSGRLSFMSSSKNLMRGSTKELRPTKSGLRARPPMKKSDAAAIRAATEMFGLTMRQEMMNEESVEKRMYRDLQDEVRAMRTKLDTELGDIKGMMKQLAASMNISTPGASVTLPPLKSSGPAPAQDSPARLAKAPASTT